MYMLREIQVGKKSLD